MKDSVITKLVFPWIKNYCFQVVYTERRAFTCVGRKHSRNSSSLFSCV